MKQQNPRTFRCVGCARQEPIFSVPDATIGHPVSNWKIVPCEALARPLAGTSARANYGPNGPGGPENAFWRQLGIHNLRSAGRTLADRSVRCAARLCLRDSKTSAREVALGAAARQFRNSIQACRAKDGKLLPDGSAVPLEGSNCYERVRTKWQAIRAVAERLPMLRNYDLRDSFPSHAIMSGESLLTPPACSVTAAWIRRQTMRIWETKC